MDSPLPAGTPGVHSARAPGPSAAAVGVVTAPCSGCLRTAAIGGRAVVDAFRLPCGHWVCALCMPAFMHAELPLQPRCKAAGVDRQCACEHAVFECEAVTMGGAPGEGQLPPQCIPHWSARCLPLAHFRFCAAPECARPEGSFAVSVSLDIGGTLQHFSSAFDTGPGGREPQGAHRGLLILLCHLMGLLCLAHVKAPVEPSACHTVQDFAAAAAGDDSLLHDCVLAMFLSILDSRRFMREFLETIAGAGRLPRTSEQEYNGQAEALRLAASVWTVVNVVSRLWAHRRVTALNVLVGTLVSLRDRGAAARGLSALGIGTSMSTQGETSRRTEDIAAQASGWNEEYRPVPPGAIIVGSCDNMGMRERAGFVQFILLTYMIVTRKEQQQIGMLEPGACEKREGVPDVAEFSVSSECHQFLGRQWREYVHAAIDVAVAVRGAEDEVHAYFMDTEVPSTEAMQIAMNDVELHTQRGGTALHTAATAQAVGANVHGIAPAHRSLGATVYDTNRVHTLPLSHADLSQKNMVNRIMQYFVGWRDAILGGEDDGQSLMHKIGIWFTCDGQPARQMLGMRRDGFYNFPVIEGRAAVRVRLRVRVCACPCLLFPAPCEAGGGWQSANAQEPGCAVD